MRLRVVVVAACAVVVSLPFIACIPGVTKVSCSAPYDPDPQTLSLLVSESPLCAIFSTAVTVWTLATFVWLREEGEWLGWAVLAFGLGFACVPTGDPPAQWVIHSCLLVGAIASGAAATFGTRANSGLAWNSPRAWPGWHHRTRAHVHRAASFGAAAAATVLITVASVAPDRMTSPLVRTFGVVALEMLACVHMVAFQTDVMSHCAKVGRRPYL